MFKSLINIFSIPDLRRRIFVVLFLIIVYRLGAVIPLPGIDPEAMNILFNSQSNGIWGFLNIFSGGALSRFSIFSLGVIPYINSSIIMSLLQGAHIFPYLDQLRKEGESGQSKLNLIIKGVTLLLTIVQSFGLIYSLVRLPIPGGGTLVNELTYSFYLVGILTMTTGTLIVIWLGEQITKRGIGNGISMIIFVGIIVELPSMVANTVRLYMAGEISIFFVTLIVLIFLFFLIFALLVETAQRRIPIFYPNRVSRNNLGPSGKAQSHSFLPIKLDSSGIIAVIFANSVLVVPVTFAQFFPDVGFSQSILSFWRSGSFIYYFFYAFLIVFFCYFYNSIQFNPLDLSNNLRRSGGFIKGVRSSKDTADYIKKIMERITLWGALAIIFIAVCPDILRDKTGIQVFLGGTGLLISVGVSLDFLSQVESKLLDKNYDRFLSTGNLKGRWFNS